MNACAVTVSVVNHTLALGDTPCADLDGCPLANFGGRDSSVLDLGMAPHAGLGGTANGNIGFGGCPCSDSVLGLAATPRASLGGAADVRLGLSGAPRASLDNTASGDLSLSGCILWLTMMEGVGAAWWPVVVHAA